MSAVRLTVELDDFVTLLWLCLLAATAPGLDAAEPVASRRLTLRPGDHLAILGNALPDCLQHSGYLEALIVAHHPQHDLVLRHLGAAGDEVKTWHRSENFGSRDEWLRKVQADVVFASYGFGESFRGAEGLAQFKGDLDQFLKETQTKNYSGKGAPRVVLFGPAADERHLDPNFPDPSANNNRLALYAKAMAEVASVNGALFVDLFSPSQQLYAEARARGQSLTLNGHYLTAEADRLLAPIIFRALFGETPPALDEKLRTAINEKNWQWHQRYRTVDGYNVYGGRSRLSYESGKGGPPISNYQVMQEEMSQRDVLTARRDQRVWAIARGGDRAVDDSNLPPATKVRSNKPGPGPDESHLFLDGQEAIARMMVHSGMNVNLFADEKQFTDLINPVQMAWDTRGRLWVAAWRNYPERTPGSKVGDSLLVLEDANGDGRADRATTFMDDLNCPTGFQFYRDGVLLVQAPDVWFLRDTDGDGRADRKERVLMGMDSADSHHTANALCLDPGGAVYLSDGVFHRTQVETSLGITRNQDAAIYRFEPRTGRFETYIAYGFANPHGRVFDAWGNDLVTDATGNNTYFGPAISGWLDYPHKHASLKEFWDRPSRPCPGTGILSSRHFPEEFQGNFLNCNVISFQGIYRVKVSQDGSGLKGQTLEHLISSRDPNFRPSAVNIGPDGAIYFADWHNPIIGHMQHHIRDPNRDHGHGRIYRITYEGRPLLKAPRIHGHPIPALLELLKEPEDNVRERAKIELGARDTTEVIAATKRWVAGLDPSDRNHQHHLLEALWVHQWHNVVDLPLLQRLLKSPEPRARAAAGRVVCYWRDRLPEALAMFKQLANDEHPRVRLEAVRGASFFRTAEAADVTLDVLKHPTDYYLDYALKETLRQLTPFWRQALLEGRSIAADNPVGMQRLIANLNTAELLKLPRSDGVQLALLARADVPDATRNEVLNSLAELRRTTRTAVVLGALESTGAREAGTAAQFARWLPMQLAAELQPHRERLESLAKRGVSPQVRQAAWAAMLTANGTIDVTWSQAEKSPESLADLLGALPLLYDQDLRNAAYDPVNALLSGTAAPPVRRAAIGALASMPRNQADTFAALARLVQQRDEVAAAARALRVLPPSARSKDLAGAVASSLVDWAAQVPASKRTEQDYVETVQLADDLAGFLGGEKATALRRQLRELRVAVFVIRTVREQMRYDTTRLVVEAGKPFEIIFENTDFMPHNLVIVKPGAREQVGLRADKMRPDQLDPQGRPYVPRSTDVLEATRLLEPGQRHSLKRTAPTDEGQYEYLCTFPEHWRVMWGQLIVTKDVEAYLRQHPEAPAPASNSPQHGHSEYD